MLGEPQALPLGLMDRALAGADDPKEVVGPELHFPNSTLAASKSVAKASHLCA